MTDLVQRLETIKNNIQMLRDKKIRLEERSKQEEEIFLGIIKEIKDLGFEPKTLKDDIVKMEQELEQKMMEKEQEITSAKIALNEIEQNVGSLV